VSGTRYEVLAVRYATRSTTKSECFYRYASYGEPDAPLQMDYFFWLLRGAGGTVLVDVGFDPVVGERRGRTCLCPPVEALARLGVAPATVSQIVLTHLHYDHVGNLAAFPDAELVVARRELDFWTGPVASRPQFSAHVESAEIARLVDAERSGRVRRLEGSGTLGPGIEAILAGGHSPGQLMLLVEGAQGPVLLTSDAVHYYAELDLDRPFEIVVDLAEMYRAYDTVRELERERGAVVVAGHDPEVVARFPDSAGDVQGLALRVG
jgi:glyoxylase-like metal-dependent hydrolase (beta-lactamase superfamily II)